MNCGSQTWSRSLYWEQIAHLRNRQLPFWVFTCSAQETLSMGLVCHPTSSHLGILHTHPPDAASALHRQRFIPSLDLADG
jgi:hypothetical protein